MGLCAIPVRVTAQAPPPTAFVDVSVIPMDRDRVLTHQTVVVRNGHIAALGPVGQVVVPAGTRRIDGRGKFLIPGLADMHTHLAYASGNNPDALLTDSAGADSIRTASAERQLFVMLANGITTIRSVDFRMPDEDRPMTTVSLIRGPALLRLKSRAAAGEILSPRMYVSANWRRDTTKSVDESVRLYKAAGFDHLKLYTEDDTLADSVIRAARRYGVPIVGHGFNSLSRTIAAGFKSVEHYLIDSPDTALVAAKVDSIARAGLWTCPTLITVTRSITRPTPLEVRYGAAEFALTKGQWQSDVYDSRAAIPLDVVTANVQFYFRRAQAAGVGIILGTDSYLSTAPPGFMVHRELQVLVRAGLTPYQALATGTINVAKYLGAEDSTGTVAIGKRADLVLLGSNPLADIHHTSDISGAMIGGRWVSRATIDRRLAAFYRGRVMPFDTHAFVDVNVVPMDRERVLAHQTVLVRDGRIAAVGPAGTVEIPAGVVRINGRGKFLIPGLADLHTHVMTSPHPARQMFELVANGVMSIRNLDFKNGAREAYHELSPRLYTSGDWRVYPGASIDENVSSYRQSGYDFLTLDTVSEPAAVIDSVVRTAHDNGVPLVRHGAEPGPIAHLVPGHIDAARAPSGEPAAAVHRALQALVGAGMRPYDALLSGTAGAAKGFGADDSTGTVAVGKRADLVLLTGNPLADIRHTQNIAGVMLGGRWMPRSLIQWRLRHYRRYP